MQPVEESLGHVREKYQTVKRLARIAEGFVDEIVKEYSEALDEFVYAVDHVLDDIRSGKLQDFAERDLHRMVLRLPIIMYRLGDMLDRSAIESDIAKAVRSNVNAQHYLLSEAKTIPAKRADAELKTADEANAVDLSRHVYQRLKSKLEHADALFDAIRKVMTARDIEKQVFGKEQGRRAGS